MEIYTKEDFKQIFIDLGIQKGARFYWKQIWIVIVAWLEMFKC